MSKENIKINENIAVNEQKNIQLNLTKTIIISMKEQKRLTP